jgi:regulator of protease activity HflC (stomatin/prohibitin superfamily)
MFITAIVLAVLALIGLAISRAIKPGEEPENPQDRYGNPSKKYEEWADARNARRVAQVITGVFTLGALLFTGFSMIYSQSAGQGVIITRIGGEVIKDDMTQGFGTKAPWDRVHKWDLFTRDVSLSEPDDAEATFEKGEITGARIATSVKSGAESGAQVWYDLDVTYNLCVVEDPEFCTQTVDLKTLYSKYRSQERFTRQVIYPAIQKAARSLPSEYTTTEFRGAGSVEAGGRIAEEVNDVLEDVGVAVTVATVKDVDFTEKVEASLSQVEEKQQQEEAARADAAAKQVQNEQLIKNAEAEAEANEIISDSLTEELIRLRQIEAYKKGTVYVVPEGSTPFVQPK